MIPNIFKISQKSKTCNLCVNVLFRLEGRLKIKTRFISFPFLCQDLSFFLFNLKKKHKYIYIFYSSYFKTLIRYANRIKWIKKILSLLQRNLTQTHTQEKKVCFWELFLLKSNQNEEKWNRERKKCDNIYIYIYIWLMVPII